MTPGATVLATALAVAALAGCTTPPDGLGPEAEPEGQRSWWFTKGIQCVDMAWEDWADDTGYEHNATPGGEPYANDTATADLIEAYYADRGRNVTAVAYRDSSVYEPNCGEPDPWNYWVHAADRPGGEHTWEQRPQGPPREALG